MWEFVDRVGDILKDNPSLSQEEIERINPFDWEKEFPEIFQRGGFSVVIGNPPYGASLEEITRDYFKNKFVFQNYQLDSYLLFLEQSIRYLLRKDGFYGMIIPNPFCRRKVKCPCMETLHGLQ